MIIIVIIVSIIIIIRHQQKEMLIRQPDCVPACSPWQLAPIPMEHPLTDRLVLKSREAQNLRLIL